MAATRLIDTGHLGHDRVIGVWERDGALIDPGPSSSIATVLAALNGEEPRALLLTHIHLDHAGATGTLVRRYPDLRVYVHEAGAPHLVDPERLLRSAARLYGGEMERLWGEVLPVPERNITALSGGERLEGLEVIHTPGHATHHVTYVDENAGDAFVGDVAGVRIPPDGSVWAPTPPPDIDVELWLRSLAAVAVRAPRRLLLTHFGAVSDVPGHLAAMDAELRTLAETARPGDEAAFKAALGERIDREPGEIAARVRAAMPPDQVWLGLQRYWSKRDGSS